MLKGLRHQFQPIPKEVYAPRLIRAVCLIFLKDAVSSAMVIPDGILPHQSARRDLASYGFQRGVLFPYSLTNSVRSVSSSNQGIQASELMKRL